MTISTVPPASAGGHETRSANTRAVAFHYTQDQDFVDVLHALGASLVVTTYQANKLLVARVAGSGLSTLVRTFDRPMGLAASANRLALGCRDQVWEFRNAPGIVAQADSAERHDASFVPRRSHVTGDICIHELAFAGDELWIVNTRFSCLCTLDAAYSFVPRWTPPFVTGFRAEDRCHLNGLAMVDGQPKYVTALGETNSPDGWREGKSNGGCLMDIDRGEIICGGLSMPHSPRWHDGRLWLLESGKGRLLLIDPATGHWQSIAEVPGFARGLTICGQYAFIGLSKIRESSTMDGVPLVTRPDELKCGVAVVDLRAGEVCALLEFQTAVAEIFDVQLLAGIRFPDVLGFQQETIRHTFILPPRKHGGTETTEPSDRMTQ